MLIDKTCFLPNENITPLIAIIISIGSIAVSWVIYDLICKSKLTSNKNILPPLLLIIGTVISFGLTKIYGQRFAFLQVGIILGSIILGAVLSPAAEIKSEPETDKPEPDKPEPPDLALSKPEELDI